MIDSHPFSGQPLLARPGKLSRDLSRAAVIVMLAVVVAAAFGLYWSTKRSDDVSVERQVRVARHSIDVALDELALQQETVAIWDETALKLSQPIVDQQWLFDNVGSWLHRIFDHDVALVLDGKDQPVQSTLEGRRVSNALFSRISNDLRPVIASVRGRMFGPNGKHDRNPGRVLASDTSVMTTSRTTHDTHLMLIAGRPAAVSAMVIEPSTRNFVKPPGPRPVLVSIRFLDQSFMADLQSKHLIEDARFSRRDDSRSGEHALLLTTEGGRPLGFLIWKPELPGSKILSVLLPMAAVAVAILWLLLLMLIRSLNHTLKEREALQARAAHLAFHDPLTGLPNRALLNDRLKGSIAEARKGRPVALLLIDLDRFKQVNDTLGHLAGDQLIREVAARLLRLVGVDDTVARLGGDEFAVVVPTDSSAAQIDRLCVSIIDVFSEPFSLFDNQVFGGASIGAAFSYGSINDATELMRQADVALYRAKSDGRGRARLFEPEMDDSGKARVRLESELREAILTDQLSAWRQPQVDIQGHVVGHEILLRWHHPTLGIISPQKIVPLAEETGLIIPIGDWVLRQAAESAIADPGRFTAVNLSPVQLRKRGFAERLLDGFAAEIGRASCRERVYHPV